PGAAAESLNGAVVAAGALPDRVAGPLLDSARAAFTLGLNTVAGIGAALFAALAVLAAVALRRRGVTGEVDSTDSVDSSAEVTAAGEDSFALDR
ncbi:MAG: hypothetical protein ACRDTB_29360, partial [Actinophytocola sp.]